VGGGLGIGVMIPLGGPGYTHEGQVTHEDEWFGGDQMYLSMTLVNASDGRVLWHLRDDLDLDAEDPQDVQEMVNRVVRSIPLRGDLVDQGTSGANKR
jgi:TolB-like protein